MPTFAVYPVYFSRFNVITLHKNMWRYSDVFMPLAENHEAVRVGFVLDTCRR